MWLYSLYSVGSIDGMRSTICGRRGVAVAVVDWWCIDLTSPLKWSHGNNADAANVMDLMSRSMMA